jgi:ribulose-5-phosphate 4-epimerase/fuculose-1-phosphate aldolase
MSDYSEIDARCDLAAAHRLAVMYALNEGTWNHMSLDHPTNPDLTLISPGYTHWSQVCAGNLALTTRDGEFISGERPPIKAAAIIHHPVHQARPDIQCLIHVHTPHITALGMQKDMKLDTCGSQQAAQFHDDIAYYEIYDGVLIDPVEGSRMCDTLGDKRILMLRNHGVIVTGNSVARAFLDLYQLERACQYQLLASAGGAELQQIPAENSAEMCRMAKAGNSDPHFAAMRRLLDEMEPGYAK